MKPGDTAPQFEASCDTIERQAAFADQGGLDYPLLSDATALEVLRGR
ncbi:MAG: hypothetical protein ACLFRV_14250 [Acidimicrobiales bacterium]